MKDPLGVSPSKGNQGTTRGKEKFILTSVGIEPTTSGLDLPLLFLLAEMAVRDLGSKLIILQNEPQLQAISSPLPRIQSEPGCLF